MIARAGVRIAAVLTLAASVALPVAAHAQQALGRYVSQDDCRFRELSVGDYAGYRRRRSDSSDRVSPYAVAVLDDAAGTLVQWGRDGARRPAVTLRAAMGAAFTGVARVTSGFGDACAVTAAGEMWCWGDNTDNARGAWEMAQVFPTRFLRSATGPAFGAVPESVSMGYAAGCATQASDGVAYCWGYNASGMNGNGTFTVRDVPRPVVDAMGAPMRNFRRFMITRSASCAVRDDDTVWCWGSVGLGALVAPINGPDVPSARQVTLSGMPFTASVIHSEDANDSDGTPDFPTHVCAVRPDGSVWCWGRNTRGALGDGTTTDHATPAPVLEGTAPLRGAVTTRHALAGTCALLADGTVRCWGDNQYGQVGDGTTTNRLTATAVLGPDGRPLDNVTQIASLGVFTRCALRRDGTLWCWGRNLAGELGDGTLTNRARAAQVTCGECTNSAECAIGPDAYSARGLAVCDVARSRCVQCAADMDCRDAMAPLCDTSAMRAMCVGRAANGELPAAARACAMGMPMTSAGCASGVCDTDGRCGLTNGASGCAGMNARCRSNVCGSDGRCGAALGGPCTGDAQCREGICASDASGVNRCVVCAPRNAATVCTGATPVCDPERGACVRCTGDQGTAASATNSAPCPNAATPFCAADGSCGRCATNADCRATGATRGGPICGAMGACGAMCRVDGDCEEGRWCAVASGVSTGMCAPRAANGSPIPSDPGATAPGPCTDGASVRCASGACGADGVCGRPDGAVCTTRDECRASDCVMGVCGGPRADAATDVVADDVASDGSADVIEDIAANDVAKVGVDAAADVATDAAPVDAVAPMDVPSADAGARKDANTGSDATTDATTAPPDAGTGTASDKGGCGCRAASPRGGAGAALVWAVLALVASRRKRR